jgi:hypothetical protein
MTAMGRFADRQEFGFVKQAIRPVAEWRLWMANALQA